MKKTNPANTFIIVLIIVIIFTILRNLDDFILALTGRA